MKKLIGVLVLLMGVLFVGFGCGESSSSTLIVGMEAGFAPYEYMDGSEIAGIDVDISREIAKDMGKELEIRNMDFDGALVAVQQGKIDFAASGISITEERKKVMDFSIEYAVSKQVIVVNKDSDVVKSGDDINGNIIGVQQGNVADFVITDDFKAKEVKRYTKFVQAAEDLKNNKIDAIVMDSLPAQEMVNANPGLKILDEELFTDKYAIAVKKGNKELLDQINKTLKRLIDEGKIEEFTLNHTTK